MAWWQRIFRFKSSTLELFREVLAQRESKAGQVVSVKTALETSVVISCGRVISEGVAQVPFKLFIRGEDGSRTEARDHPLFGALNLKPNDWQTDFEFREQIALHLALCGNAYVFKNIVSGRVVELLPFEPGWVTVKQNDDYSLEYSVQMPRGRRFDVPAENMWHPRGPSWCGYVGLDMVYQARNAIGLALATEEYGSGLFKNGARPGGIIVSKQALSPETAKDLRESWNETISGSGNAMSTAVLSGDLSYQSLSQTAEDAQFIETRKMVIAEVCRFMRVLPIMVMETEGTAAYASVEQMFLAHLTHTLAPWYRRIEQSASVNLLTEAERNEGYYVKFMANGMMRGTAKERAEYHQILLQNGVETRNEWRESEDMDRHSDPVADTLTPAANLYGPSAAAQPGG